MSRIGPIGQNGNDGEHYLVEKVAKMIAYRSPYPWNDFIQEAIEIIDEVRRYDDKVREGKPSI